MNRENLVMALRFPLWWSLAMAWHLWRMVTLSADYKTLADTWVTVGSFTLAFYAAAVWRWHFVADPARELLPLLLGLIFLNFMILVACERTGRSSVLVANILGVSAGLDIALGALDLLGIQSPSPVNFVSEVFLYIGSAVRFFSAPPEIRKAGYKRSTSQQSS